MDDSIVNRPNRQTEKIVDLNRTQVASPTEAVKNIGTIIMVNSQEYEEIRAQLHETRLKNAYQRGEMTRLNRENLQLKHKLDQQACFNCNKISE